MHNIDILHKQSSFKVLGIYKLQGTEKVFVAIRFDIPSFDIITEVMIPLNDIKNLSFKKYIPEAFFMENTPTKVIEQCIFISVSESIAHLKSQTLLSQGFNFVNDKWMYVLGDKVINDTSSEYKPYNPMGLYINYDANVENQDVLSCKWCRYFCNQGLSQTALFLCALTPYIRPITDKFTSFTGCANAFVVGTSGSGKTSYAKLVTDLCDGNSPGINLGSDKNEVINIICKNYTDRSILVDDLNLSSSDREIDSKKQKLSTVIQCTSSGGISHLNGSDINLDRTALIITGEFLPNSDSTINRCVVIAFEETFDNKALTYLQENKHLYGIFIVKFLEWVCINSDDLIEEIRMLLENGDFDYAEAHSSSAKYTGYSRIVNTYKLLRITQYLVMKFFSQKVPMFVVNKYTQLHSSFSDSISRAISTTLNSVEKKQNMSDVLMAVIKIFNENPQKIVTNNPDKYFLGSGKMFFKYKGNYFFRGESLATYLSGMLDHEISVKRISSELVGANLLELYGGDCSSKLPGKLGKNNKKRYFRLNISRLAELVSDVYPSAFDRVNSPIKELRPPAYK